MSLQLGSKRGQSAWCVYCAWATMLTGALMLAGCGGGDNGEFREYTEEDMKAEEKALEAEHGHEHGHEHDHGHGHGPHEGHLLELGEHEYHAEVVFDEATRGITVYILGGDAKTAQPIAADAIEFELEEGDDEVALTITPAPLDGEPEGQSSKFEIAADAVPEKIKSEEDLEGHLHITIEGKEYLGELHHGEHDEHGHEHADDEHALEAK